MKSLCLIQVATYGAALEAANVAAHRNLELTEIIPFGTFTQLILQGDANALVSYRKVLRTADLQKSVIIENPDPRLLKAYYHLENQKPQSYLLILENEFAGYLLEWTQVLLRKGLQISDFRQPRFPGSLVAIVLTGENLSQIQEEMKDMEAQKIKVSFVEDINPMLRSYFEIEP